MKMTRSSRLKPFGYLVIVLRMKGFFNSLSFFMRSPKVEEALC